MTIQKKKLVVKERVGTASKTTQQTTKGENKVLRC
jgi:hypothetical protein